MFLLLEELYAKNHADRIGAYGEHHMFVENILFYMVVGVELNPKSTILLF